MDIAERLLLEPEPIEEIKKEPRLKILYEIHYNRLEGHDVDALGSWIKVLFEVDGEKHRISFSYGQFDVPFHGDDHDPEVMKKITREEEMEVTRNDPEGITTRPDDRGPVWAIRVTKRILNEVYDADIGDITWAEEEEGQRSLTWEEVVKDR